MTRHLISLVLGASLVLAAVPARAHDAYDDSQSHPLLIVSYVLHPVGFGIEWLAMRPIHFIASHPRLERVFGHTPHENPFGGYEPYNPDAR